jgi:T-complex protein 1 subunit beta
MLCCAEEAERSLHDALCVLTETVKETRVVCGGGCMEMLMAAAIDRYGTIAPVSCACGVYIVLTAVPLASPGASGTRQWRWLLGLLQHHSDRLFVRTLCRQIPQTAGKAALAMEAFSRALRQLPTIIADNAGLDSSELVTQVGTCHTCC